MTRKLIVEIADNSSIITGINAVGEIETHDVLSISAGLVASTMIACLPEQEAAVTEVFNKYLDLWKTTLEESESQLLMEKVEEFLREQS